MILVEFIFQTTNGVQVFNKIEVSPANQTVTSYLGNIVTSDSFYGQSNEATININLVPGIYKCRTYGKNTESEFYINASASLDNTSQSAANLITNIW